MQCQCGSDTKLGESKTTTPAGVYLLTFQVCRSCTRVGSYLLTFKTPSGTQTISYGIQARDDYARVEEGKLPQSVTNSPETPPAAPEEKVAAPADVRVIEQAAAPEGDLSEFFTKVKADNQDEGFDTWMKPDPSKQMAVERGRHFYIWNGGEHKLQLIFFCFHYEDGTADLFIPYLNYQASYDSSSECVNHKLKLLQELKLKFCDYAGVTPDDVTGGITCAPPLTTAARIDGIAISAEIAPVDQQPVEMAPEVVEEAPVIEAEPEVQEVVIEEPTVQEEPPIAEPEIEIPAPMQEKPEEVQMDLF